MSNVVKLFPDLFDTPAEAELREQLDKTTKSLDKLRKAYWARTNILESRIAQLEDSTSLLVLNICKRRDDEG